MIARNTRHSLKAARISSGNAAPGLIASTSKNTECFPNCFCKRSQILPATPMSPRRYETNIHFGIDMFHSKVLSLMENTTLDSAVQVAAIKFDLFRGTSFTRAGG